MKAKNIVPYIQILPLAVILFLFLVVPMTLVVVVSVFRNQLFVGLVPAFSFENYADILSSFVSFQLYFSTIKLNRCCMAI